MPQPAVYLKLFLRAGGAGTLPAGAGQAANSSRQAAGGPGKNCLGKNI
jgi:hypothetical protein